MPADAWLDFARSQVELNQVMGQDFTTASERLDAMAEDIAGVKERQDAMREHRGAMAEDIKHIKRCQNIMSNDTNVIPSP